MNLGTPLAKWIPQSAPTANVSDLVLGSSAGRVVHTKAAGAAPCTTRLSVNRFKTPRGRECGNQALRRGEGEYSCPSQELLRHSLSVPVWGWAVRPRSRPTCR